MARDRSRSRDDDDDTKEEASKTRSAGVRGRAGIDKVEEEMQKARERQSKGHSPFRYKAGYDGKENPIIFLDKSLEDAFFFHEHSVQDENGNWGRVFETCVKEHDNCPLCRIADSDPKKMGRANYAMALTVLDLRPYKTKEGKKISYSRKLFVVKGQQVQDWINILEKAEKRFKTLRGVYMDLGRNEKMEAATGKPLPLESDWYGELDEADQDKPYSFVESADLLDEYGHKERKSEDGKIVYAKKNADITAFDYDELFPMPDAKELTKKYSSGKRQDDDEDDDWGSEKSSKRSSRRGKEADEDEEDDKPKRRRPAREDDEDEEEKPKSRRAKAEEDDKPKRRSRAAEPEEEDEEEEADEKPRARDRKATKDTPKPPKRTRDEAKEEVEDDEVEEEDDTPPTRRSRKSTAKAEAPKKSRRAASEEEVEDDEPEEEEDAPPRRRSASKASTAKAPAKKSRKQEVEDGDEDDLPF